MSEACELNGRVWGGWGRCSVPNIKFNVAKLTSAFVPLVGSSVVESQIRPCLLELNSDTDLDVRFFAGAFGPCPSPDLPAAQLRTPASTSKEVLCRLHCTVSCVRHGATLLESL
jgi:hypothetical protein